MPPLILVIDDDKRHRVLYKDTLAKSGFEVASAADAMEALEFIKNETPQMIISDVRMPGMDGISFLKEIRQQDHDTPFLLITAFPEVRDAVKALKLGAVDYLEKPIDLEELRSAVQDTLHIKTEDPENEVPLEFLSDIVTESPLTRSIINDAYRVSKSDATVMITGESGAGKEVLAKFIHNCSTRSDKPFIALNCAAIPPNMMASELFGHQKGAFTGALASRKGRIRESASGTLFLDEIGDMPLEIQASLLRTIETGNILPLGSDKEVSVDFRLLAATNKNLLEEAQKGLFRDDLYYRLNVISFELPPLRERPEEILPLARFFLSQKEKVKRFSPAAARILQNYDWPGNVRELSNAIERSGILANTEIILPEHLPPTIRDKSNLQEQIELNPPKFGESVKTIQQMENEAIKKTLEKTDGNRTRAAELLGISRRALIYKLKRID